MVIGKAVSPDCRNMILYSVCVLYSPTSLDAMVFGYLEVILQSPLPATNSLHQHLYTNTNLIQFCTRIRSKAFPDKKISMSSPLISTYFILSTFLSGTVSLTPALLPVPLWRDTKVWLWVGVASLLLGIQASRVGLLTPLAALIATNTKHRSQMNSLAD